MARPIKDGLDYFPLDTDMDQDDKIAYVEAKHGLIAFAIIVRLMMRIYRQGYYTMWTEREQVLFSKSINVDIETTKTIVNEYINEGFFDQKLFEEHSVLTSHGLQMRYLKGCDRRSRIAMIQEYFLIDSNRDDVKLDSVTLTCINADNNSVNVPVTSAESTQSKVKETILNKIKLNNNINACAREDHQPVDKSSLEAEDKSIPTPEAAYAELISKGGNTTKEPEWSHQFVGWAAMKLGGSSVIARSPEKDAPHIREAYIKEYSRLLGLCEKAEAG